MASWPSSLPQPLFSGYSLDAQDNTRRTDMEGGSARVRRVSTSSPDRLGLRWVFNAAQIVDFRNFWEGDWQHGSSWVVLTLRDGTSTEPVLRECRPVPASWKAVPVSATHWAVDLTVEARRA